jgi:hypothetical protein
MKPRSFWAAFWRWAVAEAVLVCLVYSWVICLLKGRGYCQVFIREGLWFGIGVGIVCGLVMAFFLKGKKISIQFRDRDKFLWRLSIALAELGYRPESQIGNLLIYKPSFRERFLSGRIAIQIENKSAELVGPSAYLRKLQRRVSGRLKKSQS